MFINMGEKFNIRKSTSFPYKVSIESSNWPTPITTTAGNSEVLILPFLFLINHAWSTKTFHSHTLWIFHSDISFWISHWLWNRLLIYHYVFDWDGLVGHSLLVLLHLDNWIIRLKFKLYLKI